MVSILTFLTSVVVSPALLMQPLPSLILPASFVPFLMSFSLPMFKSSLNQGVTLLKERLVLSPLFILEGLTKMVTLKNLNITLVKGCMALSIALCLIMPTLTLVSFNLPANLSCTSPPFSDQLVTPLIRSFLKCFFLSLLLVIGFISPAWELTLAQQRVALTGFKNQKLSTLSRMALTLPCPDNPLGQSSVDLNIHSFFLYI